MKRTGLAAACLAIGLAGCSGAATTGGTPVAKDGNVVAGDGWTRVKPGTWAFALDADRVPDGSLSASSQGEGQERFALPRGATRARLAALDVAYTDAGAGRWTVAADEAGNPAAAALASVEFDVAAGQATPGGKPPVFVRHDLRGAVVTGPFWALFTAVDGKSTTAVASLRGTDCGCLRYRARPGIPADPVKQLPYLRVVLEDVE